jgi:hypothetical protein
MTSWEEYRRNRTVLFAFQGDVQSRLRTPFHPPEAKETRPACHLLISMKCEHNRQIGDNYGITCQDCGVVLEGYGYYANGSRTCHRKYLPINEDEEQCTYCETIQEREKKEN